MKYIWPALNTVFIFMIFMYVYLSKDINIQAYDKCIELEQKIEQNQEILDKKFETIAKKDTIIINIKNYNYYKK